MEGFENVLGKKDRGRSSLGEGERKGREFGS